MHLPAFFPYSSSFYLYFVCNFIFTLINCLWFFLICHFLCLLFCFPCRIWTIGNPVAENVLSILSIALLKRKNLKWKSWTATERNRKHFPKWWKKGKSKVTNNKQMRKKKWRRCKQKKIALGLSIQLSCLCSIKSEKHWQFGNLCLT